MSLKKRATEASTHQQAVLANRGGGGWSGKKATRETAHKRSGRYSERGKGEGKSQIQEGSALVNIKLKNVSRGRKGEHGGHKGGKVV